MKSIRWLAADRDPQAADPRSPPRPAPPPEPAPHRVRRTNPRSLVAVRITTGGGHPLQRFQLQLAQRSCVEATQLQGQGQSLDRVGSIRLLIQSQQHGLECLFGGLAAVVAGLGMETSRSGNHARGRRHGLGRRGRPPAAGWPGRRRDGLAGAHPAIRCAHRQSRSRRR